MSEKTEEAAAYLESRLKGNSRIAIILGSGLGELVSHITEKNEISYEEIPNFPLSTVEGHRGRLIEGVLGGKPVLALQGRFHYYEGYDMKTVTFPVRVLKRLGVTHLFLSNAAGGMNPSFKVGDLMVIRDHINLFPEHPLRGRNDDRQGPRFPSMSEPYSKELIRKAFHVADKHRIKLQKGVYVGVQGPTYETPAEYNFYHIIGGDAVGMSTVPEVIVARHAGIQVFAISVITDMALPGQIEPFTHEEVLDAAERAQPEMTTIIQELIAAL